MVVAPCGIEQSGIAAAVVDAEQSDRGRPNVKLYVDRYGDYDRTMQSATILREIGGI